MNKLMFLSDYMEGCHPLVLKRLNETNLESSSGYGTDIYSLAAKEKINKILNEDNDIYFVCGGTQTNFIVIDTILKGYEGVLTIDTSHIATHEAGAIEFSGHKVITLPNINGKIKAEDIDQYMTNFYNDTSYPHMVMPKMVYISYPTEYGTIYSKEELINIRKVCDKYNMYLYCDGARLAYGLKASSNELTFAEFAKFFDVFYIGGTKCGLLMGEAIVIRNNNLKTGFFTSIKMHGGLLAKGRILGIQFDTLFTNNLYFEIGTSAIECASILKEGFKKLNLVEYIDSDTNQLFIILDNNKYKELIKYVDVTYFGAYDKNNTIVRFVTSWATKKEDCYKLLDILEKL